MGKGKTPLLSALLILVMLSEIRGWVAPYFCHDYPCPEFTVVNKNKDFEERMYVETLWMTVNIKSTSVLHITAGFTKLDRFCKGNNIEGITVSCKTWPGLITVTKGEEVGSKSKVSVSRFFPPDTVLPKPLNASISEEVRPAGIVYVRKFGGIATLSKALSTTKKLSRVLTPAGKAFEDHRSTAVLYNEPLDTLHVHHSEIWFNAAT